MDQIPLLPYAKYMASDEWVRRRRVHLRKFSKCNRCGIEMDQHKEQYGTALHVRHVSRANLGNETERDLETICQSCHEREQNYFEEYNKWDIALESDYLAWQLGVADRQPGILVGSESTPIDFTSSPEVYWSAALRSIDKERARIASQADHEQVWSHLERLQALEGMARACLGWGGKGPGLLRREIEENE